MQDKRRHKRFIVEGMDLNGDLMFATDVSVINISISGISIEADRRLEIGREYTIKLQGQDGMVKGIVAWSSLVGTRVGPHGDMLPVYDAGLKFTNVLSGKSNEVIHFIESHLQGEDHRLTGIRFSIAKPGRAVLHFPAHYVVKKISAGGMLIESIEAFEVERRFQMELSMPEEEPISFTGRIASCAAINIKGVEHFEIGIEFIEMNTAGRSKIEDFIAFLNTIDKSYPST